ncbi:hypothetical protein CMV30_14645 [Nibricoccus aquaticus]|uniref:Uncharacterized protein n=1 Tax=Nibricoccus aquaticus TaxID=2576891 RepID=A0A290QLY2_9BACT|nr:hypothetical protein [Nibricoccus aquaticus]ATC65092.1 hypothetical protein CMV30_14645 [Nibricoccus aquaticus]
MALWEYKVITSGLHGFASPALMETHLNTLGKDEWEIIHFQTLPNNPLAFNGLARRSTMRDWVPPEVAAVASPPRPSAYEPAHAPAKSAAAHVEEKPELPAAIAAEAESSKNAPGSSLRAFRDTERDQDPQAQDEAEDWDNWEDNQDELPTFFEAIKPLLRRNQKGPGNSAGIDQLARRWEQRESDVVGALKECGLTVPETEDEDPEYFEFEGDLFWVNRNNRGQLFINSREKPRPAFRTAKAIKLAAEDPAAVELVAERTAEKAEIEKQKAERLARQAASDAAREAARLAREKRDAEQAARAAERAANAATAGTSGSSGDKESSSSEETTKVLSGPLPPEAELLEKIRPQMRRNRRGPGYSGSFPFLARALNMSEADLVAAFTVLGLNVPENANDKPVYVEIDGAVYWINKDGRGGVWINGREKRDGERQPSASSGGHGNGSGEEAAPAVPSYESAPGPASTGPLDQDKPAQESAAAVEPAQADVAAVALPVSEESPAKPAESSDAPVAVSGENPVLTAVRLLLKPNKRGSGVSGEVGFLARTLEKSEDVFLGTLTGAGLVVPADSDAKPVFVEQAGEIFWLNKNSTDGSLWLNAKAAKSAAKKSSSAASGASRPRSRKPKAGDKDS